MIRFKITRWLPLLLAVLACPAHGDDWRKSFGMMQIVPASSLSRHVVKQGHLLYVAPHRGARLEPAEATLDGKLLNAPTYIRRGVALVGMRSFLAELEAHYGLRFDIEYLGNNKISIRRIDDGSGDRVGNRDATAFGRGWAALWDGNIAKALTAFDKAGSLSNPSAEDARALAEWLREGTDTESDSVGMVRVAWWNLAENVSVVIDDEQIVRGVPLIKEHTGVHTLRLIRDKDQAGREKEMLSQKFRVKSDEAFVIQFAAQTTKGQTSGSSKYIQNDQE